MRAVAVAPIVACVAVGAACRDREPAPPPVVAARPADAAPPAIDAAPVVAELRELTGIDAWQAVIDRARYLARRSEQGTIVGRLGGAVDGARWLIDESEGDGALAIRVSLPSYAAALPDGARVQVRGAWQVDAGGHWVWRAREVGRDVGAPAIELRHPPGLALETIAAPADGAPPSTAKRKQQVLFAVVAPPVRYGDGWIIADAPGGAPTAWLVLPGERAIYGGQELLTDDERWPLKPRERYTVTARHVRPARGDGLRTIYAADPPRTAR